MNKQQYLYRIVPTRPAMLTEGPTPTEASILQDHVNYLENLAQREVVLLAGRTQNTDAHTFGIVIFTADSENAAQKLVANDPAVLHNVMQAELFPYRISVLSPAISQY